MKLKRKIQGFICRIFGHKVVWRQSWRTRVSRRHASWKNYKVRDVRGIYQECARCGRKLSNFQRMW